MNKEHIFLINLNGSMVVKINYGKLKQLLNPEGKIGL